MDFGGCCAILELQKMTGGASSQKLLCYVSDLFFIIHKHIDLGRLGLLKVDHAINGTNKCSSGM